MSQKVAISLILKTYDASQQRPPVSYYCITVVGTAGLEPTTSPSLTEHATTCAIYRSRFLEGSAYELHIIKQYVWCNK